MLSKKKMATLLPLKNSLKQENMRNWVKVMCGRQLEALASAKAGEAAAAAAAACYSAQRHSHQSRENCISLTLQIVFLSLHQLYLSHSQYWRSVQLLIMGRIKTMTMRKIKLMRKSMMRSMTTSLMTMIILRGVEKLPNRRPFCRILGPFKTYFYSFLGFKKTKRFFFQISTDPPTLL